jgi:hypothetical protein
MNAPAQIATLDWHDPIVQELHEVREKLVEKYQGDLHAYSEAARARALALGFRFTTTNSPPETSSAS